jgi:hypothetical protein
MGTVAIYRNIRIVIFTRDHRPPHVHAIGPDAEAVFNLETMELTHANGFDSKSVTRIRQFIEDRREELLEAWNEIHEEDKKI